MVHFCIPCSTYSTMLCATAAVGSCGVLHWTCISYLLWSFCDCCYYRQWYSYYCNPCGSCWLLVHIGCMLMHGACQRILAHAVQTAGVSWGTRVLQDMLYLSQLLCCNTLNVLPYFVLWPCHIIHCTRLQHTLPHHTIPSICHWSLLSQALFFVREDFTISSHTKV